MKIYYLLNEEGRKDSLLKGGNGKEIQFIETTINEDNIKLATVSSDGIAEIHIGYECRKKGSLDGIKVDYEEREDGLGKYIKDVYRVIYFNKLMVADELIKWEKDRQTKLVEMESKCQAVLYEREKKIKEREKNNEIERRRKDEKMRIWEKERRERENEEMEKQKAENAEIQKKRQEFEEERNIWINKYGSQYLKDANALNYDIDDVYLIERAKIEHPGYQLDINDNVSWSDIKNPSVKALREVKELLEKGLNAIIVELTAPVEEDDYDDDDFDNCEAIVISNYFGNNYLIKTL